jgi:hypothetical protein
VHANVLECGRVSFMVCSVMFLLLVCLMCYLVSLVRFHHHYIKSNTDFTVFFDFYYGHSLVWRVFNDT